MPSRSIPRTALTADMAVAHLPDPWETSDARDDGYAHADYTLAQTHEQLEPVIALDAALLADQRALGGAYKWCREDGSEEDPSINWITWREWLPPKPIFSPEKEGVGTFMGPLHPDEIAERIRRAKPEWHQQKITHHYHRRFTKAHRKNIKKGKKDQWQRWREAGVPIHHHLAPEFAETREALRLLNLSESSSPER